VSAFRDAVRQLLDSELRCPKCGAMNLPPPARPTLEREQDGSLTCAQCGTNFRQEKA